MDNSNDKDKSVEETPATQTDVLNTDEPSPPELNTDEPSSPELNTDEPSPPELNADEPSPPELNADEPSPPELNADELSSSEHVRKSEDIEEPIAGESGEPFEDPTDEPSSSEHVGEPENIEEPVAGESSPDEVRTALVAIRGQNRSAHFNAGEHTLRPGDEVVIQTDQGKAIGEVLEPPVILGCRGCKHLTILRKATPEEISKDGENRELEKRAFEYCMKTIEEWEIPMRLVQVEFHLDRSKAVFYFTAEKRVDFRELVRTLAREFSTRIEMKQIGIRDEARLLGGVGPCGMAFCCSTFLKEFAPISVKMAKEQNVILNPNKISGGCGRLLCCLNYEYDQYREATRGVPKIGKKINIPEGTGKVRSVDIFSRTVTIDMTDAKPLVIDIDELREKIK